MRQCAFTPKQLSAEFVFEGLDGAGQCGLRYVATLRRLGQIQCLANCQEVSDMVHFQGMTLATRSHINAGLFGSPPPEVRHSISNWRGSVRRSLHCRISARLMAAS